MSCRRGVVVVTSVFSSSRRLLLPLLPLRPRLSSLSLLLARRLHCTARQVPVETGAGTDGLTRLPRLPRSSALTQNMTGRGPNHGSRTSTGLWILWYQAVLYPTFIILAAHSISLSQSISGDKFKCFLFEIIF